MSDREPISLDPSAIADHVPNRNCGVQWPLPVNERLERLVKRANQTGERTTRRELLSAIVATFEASDDEVSQMLRNYRRMTVGEVVGGEDTNVVRIEQYGPGPRRTGT
jgi:hypothetical protein